MFKNYLLVAFRNLSRQKGYTAINVIGLAVGMACCLMIVLFVRNELNYDRFHSKADRIYRVLREDSVATSIRTNANVLGNLALSLQEKFPAVENLVRLHNKKAVLGRGDIRYEQDGFFWSDASVFDVFDFKLESGSPSTALSAPNSVVITSAAAAKYFGEENPIGQSITLDNKYTLEVTGIVAPPPPNSHIQFSVIASMSTLGEVANPWTAENQGWTYVLLAPGQSPVALESSIAASLKDLVWWWNLDAIYVAYKLQPLSAIRLHSSGFSGVGNVGDRRYVLLFLTIAVLILLIACINYMNLATARAARRAHEVGMRKSLGAHRTQIIVQFMSEAILLSMLALGLALAIVWTALPMFNNLTGQSLLLVFPGSWKLLLAFVAIGMLTGLLSGTYPALLLSRFEPIRVLKGLKDSSGRPALRQGLVVVQFGISIVLLIGTTIIYQQMRYIQTKNLGFDTEQVIVVNKRGYEGSLQTLKSAFQNTTGVVKVSSAIGVPLNGGFISDSDIDGERVTTMRLVGDEDYVQTMGLKLASGRNYNPDQTTDRTSSILVNETMVAVHGWSDPLSETMVGGLDENDNPTTLQVIGVVKDFHTGSLHDAIKPTIIDADPKWERYYSRVIVRVEPGNVAATLSGLEEVWKQFVPEYPFDFSFLDDDIDSLYRSEQQFGKLFGIFTLLAIVIACLGLFGLAAYTAEQRTREIGIRKVLGASAENIVYLLSRDFLRPVFIAYFLAVPLAYLAARHWLDEFAFRIDLSMWIFLMAGVAAVLIAIATVSIQALRSALSDPVESLRYE